MTTKPTTEVTPIERFRLYQRPVLTRTLLAHPVTRRTLAAHEEERHAPWVTVHHGAGRRSTVCEEVEE